LIRWVHEVFFLESIHVDNDGYLLEQLAVHSVKQRQSFVVDALAEEMRPSQVEDEMPRVSSRFETIVMHSLSLLDAESEIFPSASLSHVAAMLKTIPRW